MNPQAFLSHFNLRETLSYTWIGLVGVALDACFFFALRTFTDIPPVGMTILSAMMAAALTFPLNARFTFQKSDNLKSRFSLYLLVNLFGVFLGATMMYVGNSLLGIDDRLMKGVIIFVVAATQFLLNKFTK